MDLYRALNIENKTVEADWQHDLHTPLLRGHVSLADIPRMRPTCARVYFSTVFTESCCERQYLMDKVYPKLREYCRSAHGIEFQAVDLRSGLSRDCQDVLPTIADLACYEIEECKSTSVGPCFVVFQGQRYGSEAIPPATIAPEEFEVRLKVLQENNFDITLLKDHYKLDQNAKPPVYCLVPVIVNSHTWIQSERKMVDLLAASANYISAGDWMNPVADGRREIDTGLFGITSQKFKDDNCLILKREIVNLHDRLDRKAASRFIDMVPGTNEMDFEAQEALQDVFIGIKNSVTMNNLFHFKIEWSEPQGVHLKEHEEYLTKLGNTFFEQVRRHVDVNMIEWDQYPDEELYIEVQQHWLETRKNISTFHEQGHLIAQINSYIKSKTAQPLVVYGVSGSGKSALLSKMASMASENASTLRVVLRHLGKTPASSEVQLLLQGLIKQICKAIDLDIADVGQMKTFQEIKQAFKNILEAGQCNSTLLVIIDGLDNLQATGYEQIDWLPQKLSANIKMIISTREEDSKHTLEKLCSRYLDKSLFIEVDNMIPERCEWILQEKLQQANRVVSAEQWKRVCKCLNECPYPLYIELVYQTLIRWSSFTFPFLPDSIDTLVDDIFCQVEKNCGVLVTSHIVSILTCSKYGLTEAEIEDILSIDDEVLELYPQASVSNFRRSPCLLWSRLKHQLNPYLTCWKVDSVNLVTWKYKQFTEAVYRRYLHDECFLKKIHSLVADFFIGKWTGINKKADELTDRCKLTLIKNGKDVEQTSSSRRLVISQPLIISGHGTRARLNVRKLNEMPHHLAKAGRLQNINQEVFFNYQWLHTKLSALSMPRVLADYALVDDPEVKLVGQALRQIGVAFNPDILGIELAGRLLPYYDSHPNIHSLINQCDLQAIKRCSMVPNLQLFNTAGSPLEATFDALSSVKELQMEAVEKVDNPFAFIKCSRWSHAVMRSVVSHEDTVISGLPHGRVHISPDYEHLIGRKGSHVEVFQLNSHQKLHRIETEAGLISCSDLSNQYFVFALEKKTGPFIVDIKYPSVLHRFNHRASAVAINDSSDVLIHNDGHTIHYYELPLVDRRCSITTDDTVKKILFCADNSSFYTQSSSDHVRHYTVNRTKKTNHVSTVLQQPTVLEILLSPRRDFLLIRQKKSLVIVDALTNQVSSRVDAITSHFTEAKFDFVSAHFTGDGSMIVAGREQHLGVFETRSGELLRALKVPYPSDVLTLRTWSGANKVFCVLQNGMSQVWDLEYFESSKRHKNNYYPGDLSSFGVSDDGSRIACCSQSFHKAKAVDGYSGEVIQEMNDDFAGDVQPLEVCISPKGTHMVTRCNNQSDGTIQWEVLRGDYVWNIELHRVTHFFVNNRCVVFSSDDEMMAAISCIGYSPADPSNKFFVALCYTLSGDVQEHRTVFPDGDLVGHPIMYSDSKELVCLIQPCVKTKFDGMVMEQRVDDILLYIFDIFTINARERRFINCAELTGEKSFFLELRATSKPHELLLMYARGKLPPYSPDGTLDRSYQCNKGLILYDLQEKTTLQHVQHFLERSTSVENVLVSKYLSSFVHSHQIYDGVTGQRTGSVKLPYRNCPDISPVLVLDGHYMVGVAICRRQLHLVNTRTSKELSHVLIHGTVRSLKVGKDDRTLYASTTDGRILSLTVILELSDPVRMVINKLPSRLKCIQPVTNS